MIRKKFTLTNDSGLHARPASFIVKAAADFKSDVFLIKDTMAYNAKSILGLISMGAGKGTELVLEVSGEDEEAAALALFEIIEGMN